MNVIWKVVKCTRSNLIDMINIYFYYNYVCLLIIYLSICYDKNVVSDNSQNI